MFRGESANPGDGADSYAARARAENIRLLYLQSTVALVLSVFIASLWVALMWNAAGRRELYGWIVAISIATLGRAMLFTAYFLGAPAGNDDLRWERSFALTLMPAVLVWGVGCVLVMPWHSLLHQVITFAFLVGMSGMAISTYGVRPRLTMLVIFTLLTPITVAFLLEGTPDTLLLGITGLLSILGTSRSVAVHGSAAYENYRLRHELHDAYQIAERQARTDSLTGMLNRRAFFAAASATLQDRAIDSPGCPVILVDIDDFKRINDRHGHAAGDAALRHVAEAFRANLRSVDLCGRIGGDEFAVLIPGATIQDALARAEKLLRGVTSEPVRLGEATENLTLSIGLAAHSTQLDELLRGADSAMYQAKQQGKNRIACL